MSPRRAASSRALARFSVARTSRGLEGEDALGTRVESAALQANETADAALRDGEERVQPRAAEGHLLGRALHLHELAAAGHDDVHVHLGTRVLGVAEVEQRLALDDTDADRGDVVADRRRGLLPRDLRDRVGHRDEAAGDRRGARAAIRLDHVAVHPHRALAQLGAVDDGAQGPADEPLDLLRAAARTAVLAGRARVGRARQHRVLRRDPALALALMKGGTLSSSDAVQITLVAPNSTSTEPSGWSSKSRVTVTGRSWSGARPSGRGTALTAPSSARARRRRGRAGPSCACTRRDRRRWPARSRPGDAQLSAGAPPSDS